MKITSNPISLLGSSKRRKPFSSVQKPSLYRSHRSLARSAPNTIDPISYRSRREAVYSLHSTTALPFRGILKGLDNSITRSDRNSFAMSDQQPSPLPLPEAANPISNSHNQSTSHDNSSTAEGQPSSENGAAVPTQPQIPVDPVLKRYLVSTMVFREECFSPLRFAAQLIDRQLPPA